MHFSWLTGDHCYMYIENIAQRLIKHVKPNNVINKEFMLKHSNCNLSVLTSAFFNLLFTLKNTDQTTKLVIANLKKQFTRVLNYCCWIVQCKCRKQELDSILNIWIKTLKKCHFLTHKKEICYKWISELATAENWLDPSSCVVLVVPAGQCSAAALAEEERQWTHQCLFLMSEYHGCKHLSFASAVFLQVKHIKFTKCFW